MLQVEQALDAVRRHAIDQCQALGRRDLQIRQRAQHDEIREEARHGLLRAAIRIVRQEIERAQHRARHRRRQRDLDGPRRGIRLLGNRQFERALTARDRSGRSDLALQPVRQHRQRLFHRIAITLRRQRPGNRRDADRRCGERPFMPPLAARCDLHPLRRRRRRIDRLEVLRFHRHRHRTRVRQVVVRHRWHAHRIAFGQEARRDHPQDDILRRRGPAQGRSGARVRRDRPRRQAPRRQRIRIGDPRGRRARCVGHQIGDPVDRVGELLAHVRARFLVTLEIGQRERTAPRRALVRERQAVRAAEADERVFAGERRRHAAVFAAIEEAHGIGRFVGLHREHRFVDDRQTDLSLHRRARRIRRLDREHARIARLRDRRCRGDRDLEAARYFRYAQLPFGAIQAVVLQERDVDPGVADVGVGDGHFDGLTGLDLHHLMPADRLRFLRDEHGRVHLGAANQQLRGLSRRVRFLIGHQLQILIALV